MSGVSSAVARRRVRLAIRHAREQRHLTQSTVAEAMEWSLSKVMRIESGDVTIAPNDLRPLLTFLGITDRTTVDSLVHAARTSRLRRQMWYDEPRFRDMLSPATRQLFEYATEAKTFRFFFHFLVPGILQTPAYAEAVLHAYEELSEEGIRIRLEAREVRRREFLERQDKPTVLVLLDESVIHRTFATPAVLSEQCAELLRLAREHRILIRILPFTASIPPPMHGSFELLSLTESDTDPDSAVYREFQYQDELIEEPALVARHRENFERLWKSALDEEESVRLIAAVAGWADGRPNAG